jgi:hypothetical protein
MVLDQGPKTTGGHREDLLTSMALAGKLSDLARELKTQYRVAYARPEMLIGADALRVTVREPQLIVRASRVPR